MTTETTAIARVEPNRSIGLLRPIAPPADVIAAQNEVREYVAQTLKEGRDYGKIPGTGDKPTLLKPGAERVCNGFGLTPRFEIDEKEIDHDRRVEWSKRKRSHFDKAKGAVVYNDESGVSFGLYRYVVRCVLVHRESGAEVGGGLGSASTLETKYVDRPRDLENTILKMACKRAFIAATLIATGLSDQFTQDVEDLGSAAVGDRDDDKTPAGDGAFVMPFGKTKGATLAELEDGEIKSAVAWVKTKAQGKFTEFVEAAERWLKRDRNAPKEQPANDQQEMPGWAKTNDERSLLDRIDAATSVEQCEGPLKDAVKALPQGSPEREAAIQALTKKRSALLEAAATAEIEKHASEAEHPDAPHDPATGDPPPTVEDIAADIIARAGAATDKATVDALMAEAGKLPRNTKIRSQAAAACDAAYERIAPKKRKAGSAA